MESSVFVEFKFWLLIVASVIVPVFMYLLQQRKSEASPLFVLTFGLALTTISGVDVYLLQALAAASRLTPSLGDDAVFNSEMYLGLYAFPLLFGGIGINMVSDMLVKHLMSAEERYEEQHSMPGPSSRRTRERTKGSPGLPVQLGKPAGASLRAVLSFTSQKALYSKIGALIESLEPGAKAPGIPLNELFSPVFMATHTRFGSIDEMIEANAFSATSPEDGGTLSGESWDACVRSTTRFAGWADMLQTACGHWMAHQLHDDHADRTRTGAPFSSAWATTTFQPHRLQRQDASAGTL